MIPRSTAPPLAEYMNPLDVLGVDVGGARRGRRWGGRLEAPSHASTGPPPRATAFFTKEGGMSAFCRTPSCDKGVALGFGLLSVGVGGHCSWVLGETLTLGSALPEQTVIQS